MSSGPLVRWGAAVLVGASSLALLGACGGKEKEDPSAEEAAASAEGGNADGGNADQAGAGGVPDICTLLDAAAVEQLLGEPATGPGQDVSNPGTPMCSYVGANSNLTVQYGTEEQTAPLRDVPGIRPVSGVGEEAYERGSASDSVDSIGVYTLSARVGDHWLQFSLHGADPATVQAVMAEAIQSIG